MLEVMRKALKGWAGKALIILFTAPFLFFGVESVFSTLNSSGSPIEVNGESISEQALTQTIERNKEQIRRRFGEDFDTSLLSSEAMREGAVTQLVEDELTKQYADKNNLSVSFAKLSKIIRELPFFADESGKFSQQTFETIAVQQGYTTKTLVNLIKEDVVKAQPREAIALSSFALSPEVELTERLRKQKRDIAYLTLQLDDFRKTVVLNEEEITAYYENHSEAFMTEESVSIEYIELLLENLKQEVSVSDEQILERFREEQAQRSEQLERKASHILVAIDDSTNEEQALTKINELKEKLGAGEDFAELAKNNSDDTASARIGGDLGFAGRGAYVEEFENTLFSLEKNQISEPVLTEFGYHIIKLTDIGESETVVFDKEKNRIKESLILVAAQDLYQSKIATIEEIIFESPDLDEVASTLGLEVKVTKQFTREVGEGMASHDEVRKLAFSDEVLKQGENSTVIEINTGNAIALRLKEHQKSFKRSLDTVRDDIVLTLKTESAEELITEKKNQLLEMLKNGDSANDVAAAANVQWQVKAEVKRQEQGLPQEVLQEAFKMAMPAEGAKSISSVNLAESNVAIITLTKVHESNEVLNQTELDRLVQQRTRVAANADWSRHVSAMKNNANIVYKKKSEDATAQ